ncbi:BapA prefix-like domain-containing protein [Citrobacter sedlakii]|uniref:BapA/Bap/LapF family large adhesin n=1 Tax=Citrobacter sedlakii TaxID=67826 RepID=UPI0019021675|nr:BapA/Bap/LapF family large adhesin [Citrobacter sedlakii]MBJ9890386.1 BapA prefix-like domain-containing protein [Citrobacter sedlakii]
MRLLAVVSKLTGVSTNVEASEVTLNTPSIVKLSAQREEISQLARVNQDLVITFHSGEKVTIKNFYVTNDQGASQLVLEDDNGALWWVENPEAGLQFEQISSIDELLITAGGANEGAAIWPWVLGGVVAAGGIAAIAASGGGGGDDDDDNGSGNPGGGTDNGGGGTTTPPPGSVDTTPPASPLITSALDAVAGITGAIQNGQTTNDNQPVLSGTGEVGAVITVYDNGQVLGTTTVDASGNWSFKPPSSLADGEHELTVTATDKAGNTSIVSGDFTFVVDTQAPGAITDLAISADGLVISGNAEADSTVTITNSDGTTLGTVTADSNGKFTLTLTQALQNGEVLTAIAMDKAGNSGPSGTVTAPDSTPPQPAGNLDVSDDGTTVTGTAEPGSTITIRDPAGNSIGQGKTDDQGNFNVVLDTPQTNGETVTVVVTDTANLTSPPATAVAPDTTPPQPAGNLDVSDDGTTVTGTAEPGSTITIRDPDGNPVGEGVTDEQGNFSVDLNTPQKNGETLAVTATDGSNNTSQPANVQAPDITAPQAPVVVSIVDDAGDVKGDLTAGQSTDDNQLTFSGTGEPGATITILDGGTALPGSVIVGSDGTWTLTTPVLEDGNHNFTVTATDANNQTSTPSPSVTLTVDTSAPDAPFITSPTTPAATNQPELPIIGTGEPGSTVTLSDGNTVVGTAVVDGDGNWTITPAPALTEGSYTLTAVATDPAGNQSQPSAPIVLEVDTTPPATPESVVISQDGGTVTGTAETGSTVIIRDADGNIIGSGVATDGTFSIAITPAQTGNAGLTATAQDTAGNTSPAANFNGSGSGLPVISAVVDDEGSVLGDLRSGQTTDDTLPGLRGTATPDSTLNVLVDGVNVGTVTVDGTGSWVWTATAALGEGTHTFQVVDSANAENASAVVNITVDLTAPVQPVIGSVTDDVAPGTGTLASGDTTNDSRPALSGTGTDGETISIYDGATLLGQVQVENGVWNFTPPTALGEGSHSLTITATDAAGNVSAPSASFEVVVDTTAPLVPAITSATDDSDPQTSIISDGGSTNDTTPTFSGSGENGSIVTIFDNGVRIGTATVTNGSWSFTPSTLSDGTHSITVTATDATGNISAPSGTYTITVDTIPPQPAGNLDVSDDGVTVTGTAEAGATVTIYGSDSAPLGSAVVQDDGTFTVTLNTPLTNGQIVTAIVTDPANQESTPASVTAPDTTPPQPAGNLDVSDDGVTVTGTAEAGTSVTIYASDNTPLGSALVQPDGTFTVTLNTPQTNGQIVTAIVTDPANQESTPASVTAPDTTPPQPAGNLDVSGDGATVTGTAEAGTTVTIYASDNTPLGSALVQPDGSFTVTLDTPQTNGEILTAVVTDTVNLTSPPSTTIAPDITPPQPAGNLDVSDDGATVTGTAEPGSTVTIRDPDGNPLGQGTTDDQGNFSVDLDTPQTNGESLTAVVTDPANQESTPASVTAPDTTAPLPPSNVEVSGDGSSLTATAEPGSRITVKDSEGNTLAVSDPVPANGTVTVSFTPAVVNGETLTVTATDGSNNTSQPTSVQAPDITAPEAPVVVSIADDFGGVNGNLDTGQSTDDNRLTFSGTGEPGATITILNGGVPLSGTAIVDPDGNWTLTTDVLPDGEYTFTATATDGQDQTSPASDAVVITVDTTAPTAPVLTITDNTGEITGELTNNAVTDATQPVLSGSGTAGDIITVYDGTTAIGTTEVTNAGTWSFTPAPALSEGSHTLSVTASDPLGNTSANSAAIVITVDTTAPATPALTVVDGDDAPLSNGQATNETQPVLSGTGVNGERVTIYDKGVEVATVTIADGTWEYPSAVLGEGEHVFTITVTDAAGNVSAPSAPTGIVVDTTAPATPNLTITDNVGSQTGSLDNAQFTDDTLPLLSGSGTAGDTIIITLDGVALPPLIIDNAGNWSYQLTTPLTSGDHVISLTVTDPAGNSTTSPDRIVRVDAQAPTTPTLTVNEDGGPLSNGGQTNDTTPTLSGTGETGSIVTILNNGVAIGTAEVIGGAWNFTPTTPLAEGSYSFSVTASDAAGNISPPSAEFDLTVDTRAPDAPFITSPTSPAATNQPEQPVSGTGEPGSTVILSSGATVVGTALVDGDGNWTIVPDAPLTEGSYTLTAVATDPAGNASQPSAPITLNVDLTPPATPQNVLISDDGGTVTGTAEAGSTVIIRDNNGNVIGTGVATGGNFSIDITPAQTGTNTLTATAQDAAGNLSIPADFAGSGTGLPVISAVVDDAGGVQGDVRDGETTDDTLPGLRGSATPGSTLNVLVDGVNVDTVTVDGTGNWVWTATTALGEGEHTFQVVDSADSSKASAVVTITLDLTPPAQPVIGGVTDDVGPGTGTLTSGDTTNDARPTLNGTGTDGETISIYDGATLLGVTQVVNGVWSFTPTTALGEGSHSLTITATDAAGNVSAPSAAFEVVVDTTAPLAPAITSATDDSDPQTGIIANGGSTNDTTPAFTGSGEEGSTITFYDNGVNIGTTTVTNGSWSFTPPALSAGTHTITVTATDAIGNVSAPSAGYTVTVDTAAPRAPVIQSVTDDTTPATGVLANGQSTNDSQPTFQGTAEPGATVTLYDGATVIGSVVAGTDGSWSLSPDSPLSSGLHNLTVTATDAAGNEGPAASFTLTVDTQAPSTPVISAVTDDVAPNSGTLANGQSTNDTRPTLSGTAEANSTVNIFDGTTLLGTVQADGTGAWTFTPPTALASGSHTFNVTATDAAGNVSPGAGFSLVVDTVAPVAPAIVNVTDNVTPGTGDLTNGQTTNDPRPVITGTGEPGSTINVFDGSVLLGTAVVNEGGSWSYRPDGLAQGTHTLRVTATDSAGNTGPASANFTLTVDTAAPVAPVISSVTDDAGPVTGSLTSGQSTNDTRPTFTGTGEPGTTISVADNGVPIGTATVGSNGAWTFTPTSDLGQGTHPLTFTPTDAAGNTGPAASFTLAVDSVAPLAPAITSVVDDSAPQTGNLSPNQSTNDTRPTLNGTGEAGTTLTFSDNGTVIGSVVVSANGTWSFTPTTALSNGPHTLSVSAADTAGNVGPSSSFSLTVDTQTPAAPVITTILDDVSNNTGAVGSGQSTNDTLPELRGTSEPGAFINIYDGATLLTPTPIQADANGAWSFTPTTALGEGSHSFTAQATDAAGNVSPTSAISTIVVDTTPPAAPANLAVVANGTSVTGTAEAGSTITITGSNGTVLGTGVADGSGNFSIVITPAQVGGETLQVVAQDRAGNIGTAGSVEAPFTGLPGAPVIVSLTDEVGSITGLVANGQATNDATPLINGTAQPSSTITIYSDGVAIGTTTANAQGSWSFTPPAGMADGAHALTATATNANGTGTFSSTFNVTIDTVTAAPTGSISADGASISGTAEAGSTVTITLSTGETLTTTANSSGNYTLTFDRKQTSGENISVSATDAVGNVSTTTQVQAPTLPIAASDNVENLTITTDATVTTNDYSDYGLLLVGALGNVANVLGNDTAAVEFTVQDGGSANLVIDASTTGVVLSLLNTQEVAIQKYDAATNSWTTVIDTAQAQFANLLTLGSSGVTVNVTGLEGGTYRVLTYNTALLATGSYTALNVNVEQTSAGAITSAETQTGNVLNNDSAPQDTVVTTVTSTNGNSVTLGSGSSVLQGVYGTLTINPDGSYSYALNPNSPASVVGRTESFTYTITGGGNTTSAKLVITLGNETPASSVTAVDNVATLPYDTLVDAVNNGPSSQGGFTVVNVSLGNVLDVGVLDRLSNPIIFDVEEGTTRTMTLQSSIGGVAVASSFDLYIYRFNDVTQQFEQWRVERNWLNAPLLGGQSNPLTLNLPGGEYLFLLNPSFGITALTGYTLNILEDHVYSVESLSTTTQGNVLNDDVAPDGTLVTLVNGVAVAQTGTTTIVGAWGTLTIDAQGNYTYTLKSGLGADSTSTPDSFVYTVRAPNGDTDTASLNIQPTARALDAVNDVSDTLIAPSVQDTVSYLDSSVGTASWGAFGRTGSGSGTFDVAAGTILKGAAIVFNVSTLITLGNLTITWTVLENGVVIRTGTVPVSNITLGGATVTVNLTGLELDGGTYTLNFTGNNTLVGAATITPRITGTTVDLDNFETSGTHTVNGNIFDGSDASGVLDQLNTVDTRLTVTGFNGSTATLDPYSSGTTTIQGQYGSLQIRADGSYTYTLDNGVALSSMSTKETFTYKLDDTRGHTDTATLTVDIAPQVVSTTQNDVLVGSAYGDTLIYNLLNASSATGGNGTDTWRNFSLTQSDKIDIGDLLVGWNGDNATLGSYLNVSTSGGNTTISIDRDGAGSTYQSTALVTLENVQTTLNELIEQNHIVT